MPTYTYETIPTAADEKPRRFEVFQRMTDEPLTHDPESGDCPMSRMTTSVSKCLGMSIETR